ncbi:carotenoid ester lipase precursor [Lactarius hatsudake]|nr:carotenoid ester lipase precursor [Lactarius hatsudake]
MASLQALLVAVCAVTNTVLAFPTTRSTSPIVALGGGEFIGTTSDGVNKFLGIPFAQPPFVLVGALGPYSGTHNATAFGLSCPQQATTQTIPNRLPQEAADFVASVFPIISLDSEDCLTLNVITPACAKHGSKLPVVVWIYGGETYTTPLTLLSLTASQAVSRLGSSSLYDGSVIVKRSIALKEPVVYVSLNYRWVLLESFFVTLPDPRPPRSLAAFGFLASQEFKDAGVGNLGLHDQRMALRWIQKYIYVFGGDSSKVTIWGQSAGSVSVSLQMLTNGGNTEGLFRAAFMQSGTPPPIGDITHGQRYYDDLVVRTGCSGSSDTLACLRAAPYDELKAAMDSSQLIATYNSLALVWQQGSVASIPFVTGDCDDEGTLFALFQLNVTAPAEPTRTYAAFYQDSSCQMQRMLSWTSCLRCTPQDDSQGSPYDTGTQNAFAPQFKRIASILGDSVFQAPRRFFLNNVSDKQKTWSFLSKRLKSMPVLGSAHGTDIRNIYGTGELTDYLIHFATHLDPNSGSSPQ